jgi:hypothetical protein
MGGHFFILALIHLLQGIAGIAGAALLGLGFVGVGALAATEDAAGGAVVGTLGLIIAAVIALFSVPELLCGWWMLKRKPLGRILGIVLAILYLPGFPIWTAIGAWSLWALLSEQGAADYKRGLGT